MKTLNFMGFEAEKEAFRCRVYDEPEEHEAARIAFLQTLATEGVLDAPALDGWIDALKGRGWIASTLESATMAQLDGREPGKVKRWRLNEAGRAALADLEKAR